MRSKPTSYASGWREDRCIKAGLKVISESLQPVKPIFRVCRVFIIKKPSLMMNFRIKELSNRAVEHIYKDSVVTLDESKSGPPYITRWSQRALTAIQTTLTFCAFKIMFASGSYLNCGKICVICILVLNYVL